MNFILQPWQLAFVILAGWVNHQQQQVIDYLRTENQVLKEKIGKKRILLNDDQRRRLAVKGRSSDASNLEEVATICHAGHDPALASNAGGQEMGLQRKAQERRTAAHF